MWLRVFRISPAIFLLFFFGCQEVNSLSTVTPSPKKKNTTQRIKGREGEGVEGEEAEGSYGKKKDALERGELEHP